jgi:purine-binding chemotaxis protein CheW
MTGGGTGDRLADLRHAFDSAFALPPPARDDDLVDLLAVTVGADALAVPLAAMAGLVADRAVTPLPGSPPDLIGVAGLRGHLVPVYDLAGVLGSGRARGPENTVRWMVLAAGSPAFAVAVDRVDGHLRVPRDAIADPVDGSGPRGAVVHTAAGARPVVDLTAVRHRVTARAAAEES